MGQDVKLLRQLLGLTQAALAKRLQVHPLTVARWEQHPNKPISRMAQLILAQFQD